MRWALDNSAIKPEPLAVEAHILSPELSGKPKKHSQSRNTEWHRKVLKYKAPLKNKCYLSSSWLQWSKMQKQRWKGKTKKKGHLQYLSVPNRSEGDQPWVFFGRTDAKAETLVLWPPHAKSDSLGKTLMLRVIRGRRRRGQQRMR